MYIYGSDASTTTPAPSSASPDDDRIFPQQQYWVAITENAPAGVFVIDLNSTYEPDSSIDHEYQFAATNPFSALVTDRAAQRPPFHLQANSALTRRRA